MSDGVPVPVTASNGDQNSAEWSAERARAFLREMFDAAVASASPSQVLAQALPEKPTGRCVVVGAGKASAAMAAALEAAWPDVTLEGVVVTRDEHAVPTQHITILEASHPVPDERSEQAARAILKAVDGLGPDDLVIALISGGGSSLLSLPAEGITLEEKKQIGKDLLHSGATITEMNTVRRHLSAIKGGRLAQAAYPARVATFVISDVPGDDPSVIASGPTVPDQTTALDALRIVRKYDLTLPDSALALLKREADHARQDTPAVAEGNSLTMIATPFMALQAAADVARKAGVTPVILGDAIEGESCSAGIVFSGIARSVKQHGVPVSASAVLLSGGETTVTIKKGETPGRGGRNTEFLLACAQALGGESGIWAMAGDSDGIDGTEDAAGAIVTPDTLARGEKAGVSAEDFLKRHDSYSYFKEIGDLVITGPTLTNVNDIRILLVL
ncbi:hydroxypyruvate reductase [Acetobacter indonesiensis]|uniref:Hydroxypyruvate reductase n=2 Tax=Acetobacter indonesiensis TaxID=104101 RepID=A0A252ATV5_9PROT|nr:hydroxypyruvate reductase [Acetobacter indonesiensis]